jgi:hypothetical protein
MGTLPFRLTLTYAAVLLKVPGSWSRTRGPAAKAAIDFVPLTARLKPHPFKTSARM